MTQMWKIFDGECKINLIVELDNILISLIAKSYNMQEKVGNFNRKM